jgi:cell division protein FtsL
VSPFIIILAIIVVLALIRLRSTYVKTKKFDRSEEIQQKLAELKRKRDEEKEQERE